MGGCSGAGDPTYISSCHASREGSDKVSARPTGVDHVIVGVRDLADAAERWLRLGFALTPRGRHVGWGTANVCIMLERDYIELLGIVDPARFTNDLDSFLAEREGLLGVALGTADAVATAAAWQAAGLGELAPRELARILDTRAGEVVLRFANVIPAPAALEGLRLFGCRHLTPELLRRPDWLDHPNGATGLAGCTIVARDPAALAGRLGRIFGSGALTGTDRVTAVHTGSAVLLVAGLDDAQHLHPGFAIESPGDVPLLQVLGVRVRDPDAAAGLLRRREVPHRRDAAGAVLVEPEHATGVALELVAA
jgi:hypothetical protein